MAQTFRHFHLHIIDNHSQDETQEIVNQFLAQDSRIIYTRHNHNIGMVNNFQFALQHVNTHYFSFICDDDLLLPHFLTDAMSIFKKYPELGFVSFQVLHHYMGNKIGVLNSDNCGYYAKQEGLYSLVNKLEPILPGILFGQHVLNTVPELDVEVGASFDTDFILKIASHFPIYFHAKPAAIYFSHANSASFISGVEFFYPGWLKIIKNIEAIAVKTEIKNHVIGVLRKGLVDNLENLVKKSIRLKDYKLAEKILRILQDDLKNKKKKYRVYKIFLKMVKHFPLSYYCWEIARKINFILYKLHKGIRK